MKSIRRDKSDLNQEGPAEKEEKPDLWQILHDLEHRIGYCRAIADCIVCKRGLESESATTETIDALPPLLWEMLGEAESLAECARDAYAEKTS